jgi:hypothetical protein
LQRVATERSNENDEGKETDQPRPGAGSRTGRGRTGLRAQVGSEEEGTSKAAVKKALKKISVSRKRLERRLAR